MADRYDVVSFKQTQSGKTFAIKLGSAVRSKKGDGWQLYLDAIPAPVDGQYVLSVVPPKDRQQSRNAPPVDDEIPW